MCIFKDDYDPVIDQENPQIDIKQQNGTLECSVSGIETNITFSWTHYTKDGEHISCHDRTGPLLLLTKYEPYETEGIYSCAATFNETDNVKNTSVLQKSVNISAIEGKPYCLWMKKDSMWREDETANIKVYVYSAGGVTFRLARPDSNVHENDTTVNSISTKRTSYPVNTCNTIIDVDVQEYQLELSSLFSIDLNMTLTLLINNTVGETYCSHTFFVGNETADDDADKHGEESPGDNIKDFIEFLKDNWKYLIGSGCLVIIILMTGVSCYICGKRKMKRLLTTNSPVGDTSTGIEMPHFYHTIQYDELLQTENNEDLENVDQSPINSSNDNTSANVDVLCARSYTSLVEVLQSDKHEYESPVESSLHDTDDVTNLRSTGLATDMPYSNLFFDTTVKRDDNSRDVSEANKLEQSAIAESIPATEVSVCQDPQPQNAVFIDDIALD